MNQVNTAPNLVLEKNNDKDTRRQKLATRAFAKPPESQL